MNSSSRLIVIGSDDVLRRLARAAADAAGQGLTMYAEVADFVGDDDADGIGCIIVALDALAAGPGSVDGLSPYVRRWPVILCAADAEVAAVVKAMKWGAFDFLTRPAEDDALTKSVERAVAERQRARRARRRLEKLQSRLGALTRREAAVLRVAMGSAVAPRPLLNALRRSGAAGEQAARVANGRGGRGLQESRDVMARVDGAGELTPRLRETLELLLRGSSEKQVASQMGLSRHTVHDYVKALHRHFGVSSRGELLAHCLMLAQEPGDNPRGQMVC